ncbi:MAG: hypothetical protein VW810_01530, partial [Pelagibacteraceae bacterium]
MFFKEQINSKNLRITLETLINIRWIAVIGQFFTVSFVYYGLKFKFPYIETLILISISVLINIFLEKVLFKILFIKKIIGLEHKNFINNFPNKKESVRLIKRFYYDI